MIQPVLLVFSFAEFRLNLSVFFLLGTSLSITIASPCQQSPRARRHTFMSGG